MSDNTEKRFETVIHTYVCTERLQRSAVIGLFTTLSMLHSRESRLLLCAGVCLTFRTVFVADSFLSISTVDLPSDDNCNVTETTRNARVNPSSLTPFMDLRYISEHR